jgi:uncharacterized protein
MSGSAGRSNVTAALRALLAVLLLTALGAPVSAWAQTFPKLTGRVVDAANVIPDDQEARLVQKLDALEKQSKRQLVVATIPDLQGYDISDYGYQLGRAWGIGDKERNDGALLIVAPTERKLRVEAGYGLEGVITDGLSSLIISQTIVPRFKAGDLPGGIEAGTDALINQLTLPDSEARLIAQKAGEVPEPEISFDMIFFMVMILFFIVIPFFRTVGKRRRMGTAAGSVFIWDMLSHMPSSSSGGGGGFSGGGGGFSGGGGSFGGGGSSGSW